MFVVLYRRYSNLPWKVGDVIYATAEAAELEVKRHKYGNHFDAFYREIQPPTDEELKK